MAYCNHCGAYIPDGQTKCLACGFDEQAEQAAAQAAAAQAAAYAEEAKAREQAAEDARAEVERRRAQRQEYNKTWAANEQRNRRMEEEFRRRQNMEEEFRRRRQEAEERAQSFVNRAAAGQQAEKDAGQAEGENSTRGLAALSYLWLLFLIPMFSSRSDDFSKYHAKQGAKLAIAAVIGNIVGGLFGFAWAVDILAVVLAVKGIGNAVNGRKQELPVIGKWFNF